MILHPANTNIEQNIFQLLYSSSKKGYICILFLFVQGDFREENFNTAMSVLQEAGDAGKGDQRGRRGGSKGQT